MNLKFSIYQFIIFLIYIICLLITYNIYYKISTTDLLSIINLVAIFVTLGSALIGLGSFLISQFEKRIFLDIEILNKDILKIKEIEKWKRWPFFERNKKNKLINGTILESTLCNPTISFSLGFININIPLPTTYEDFFDLHFLIILYNFIRKKNQFYIYAYKNLSNNERGIEIAKYKCILDILLLIFKIRLIKLTIHFGISLTLFSLFFLLKI